MAKYSYGISAFTMGDIDGTTGLQTSPVDLKETVYKDTFNVTEEEGSSVDHYSEMDSTPKISFQDIGKETITFQMMDTDVDKLVLFLGGTKTVVGGRDTWNKPSGAVSIEKYIKVTTLDGTDLEYPRVQVSARKNFQLRKQGIWLLDVTMTVLTPLLPSGTPLSPVIVTDPAP